MCELYRRVADDDEFRMRYERDEQAERDAALGAAVRKAAQKAANELMWLPARFIRAMASEYTEGCIEWQFFNAIADALDAEDKPCDESSRHDLDVMSEKEAHDA